MFADRAFNLWTHIQLGLRSENKKIINTGN